jgi:hypothetical protein
MFGALCCYTDRMSWMADATDRGDVIWNIQMGWRGDTVYSINVRMMVGIYNNRRAMF